MKRKVDKDKQRTPQDMLCTIYDCIWYVLFVLGCIGFIMEAIPLLRSDMVGKERAGGYKVVSSKEVEVDVQRAKVLLRDQIIKELPEQDGKVKLNEIRIGDRAYYVQEPLKNEQVQEVVYYVTVNGEKYSYEEITGDKIEPMTFGFIRQLVNNTQIESTRVDSEIIYKKGDKILWSYASGVDTTKENKYYMQLRQEAGLAFIVDAIFLIGTIIVSKYILEWKKKAIKERVYEQEQ